MLRWAIVIFVLILISTIVFKIFWPNTYDVLHRCGPVPEKIVNKEWKEYKNDNISLEKMLESARITGNKEWAKCMKENL